MSYRFHTVLYYKYSREMFPPPFHRSTSSVRQYKRYTKRRSKKRSRRLGATAQKHALRMSPIRQENPVTIVNPGKSSARSLLTPSVSASNLPSNHHRTRAEARARLFSMKRRIVDRLLQKKAGLMGGTGIRQDARLLILAYKEMDADGSGSIDYNEFVDAIGPEGLNVGLAPNEIDDLFLALDTGAFFDTQCSK